MNITSENNQEGYIVLITVLILGVVAATVAIFLLLTGTDAGIASSGVEANVQTRSGAMACAELALGLIQSSPTITTPVNDSSTLDSSAMSDCNYEITGSTPNYIITATGKVRAGSDNFIHKIVINVDQVSPKINVSSWLDSPL